MFPASSLLSYLLLAVSLTGALASPVAPEEPKPATLSVKARFLPSDGSAINIVERDSARRAWRRANVEAQKDKRAVASIAAINSLSGSYIANVGIGSSKPPTNYELLIDTGSSNIWVNARPTTNPYVKTASSVNTGRPVSVSYGEGTFSGVEYTDTVTLSPNLVITKQSIGVASSSSGFETVDGVLGLGPVLGTEGTVTGVTTVPTVADNLYAQGTISSEVVGFFFQPTASGVTANGELSFGAPDPAKYTGPLNYVPTVTTSPTNLYWGITLSINYGSTALVPSSSAIIDASSVLVYLPSNVFSKYQSATGGKPDAPTGLLKITSGQYSALQPLNIVIGGTTYQLSPNAQIWPRSLNTAIGGDASSIYLIVANSEEPSSSGLGTVLGYAFLQRFYTVLDTTNKRVGFASTTYTSATTN